MKKILATLAMVAVAGGLIGATIDWNYTGDIGVGFSEGWIVQLYQDVSGDSILSSLSFDTVAADGTFLSSGNGSDDILLGATTALALAKGSPPLNWAVATQSVGDAIKVYTVVFNSSSMGSATQGIIIDAMTYTTPNGSVGTYTQNTVNGTWQAVPEPATAMLLALGGGLAWLVRLKQRLG